MKKVLIVCAAILAGGLAMASFVGGGRVFEASVAPTSLTGFTANRVSVRNQSTTVRSWAMVNTDSTTFSNAVVLGETGAQTAATPIPPNTSIMFDAFGKMSIYNVFVATGSGTATNYVAIF